METKEQYESRMAAAIAARDSNTELGADGRPGDVGATAARRPAARRAGRSGTARDAGRWHTLNAFYDFCAEHLTPAEKAVWGYLNRHCRGGKASGSMRDIARNARVDFKTATVALRWLIDVGLVYVVSKSTHKGSSSVYGMHLHPEQCRVACEAADAPRKERKKRRPAPIRVKA
jgi:hypothetical protein